MTDTNTKKQLVSMTDADLDIEGEKIDTIISNVGKRLLGMLDTELDEVPEELDYIVVEVSIKRYNQLGDEGMASRSQEGESVSFSSALFDEFLDDIKRWNDKEKGVLPNSGKWSFK